MKNLCIILTLLLSFSSYAQKIAVIGENIATDKMNSSLSQIGEIKQALLTQSEFQQLNGDCWVGMNGQSISGSDYANFTGRNVLPDANGRFMRNAGGSAAALGQTQEDEFKTHTHTQNAHNHLAGHGRADGFPYSSESLYGTVISGSGAIPTQASGNYTKRFAYTSSVTATNQNTGGDETRPKNLTVNMFIKINKQCNF